MFLKHVGFYSLLPQQKHVSIFFSFLKSSGMRWVCKTEQCMSSYTPLFHNFFVVGLLQMSDEHKGFGLGSE